MDNELSITGDEWELYFGVLLNIQLKVLKFKKINHEIVAVITQPDKKRSRGNKLIASPVKEYATKDIPVLHQKK